MDKKYVENFVEKVVVFYPHEVLSEVNRNSKILHTLFSCKSAVLYHFSPLSTPPTATTTILSLILSLILISEKWK